MTVCMRVRRSYLAKKGCGFAWCACDVLRCVRLTPRAPRSVLFSIVLVVLIGIGLIVLGCVRALRFVQCDRRQAQRVHHSQRRGLVRHVCRGSLHLAGHQVLCAVAAEDHCIGQSPAPPLPLASPCAVSGCSRNVRVVTTRASVSVCVGLTARCSHSAENQILCVLLSRRARVR